MTANAASTHIWFGVEADRGMPQRLCPLWKGTFAVRHGRASFDVGYL